MRTDDFINFFRKTLIIAALDLRKEKKRLFANIIANSALIGNADVNDGRKYLFDETIDKIDERLFEFLVRIRSRRLTTEDDEKTKDGRVMERNWLFWELMIKPSSLMWIICWGRSGC